MRLLHLQISLSVWPMFGFSPKWRWCSKFAPMCRTWNILKLDLYPVVSSNGLMQGNVQHTRWLKLWPRCLAIYSLYLDRFVLWPKFLGGPEFILWSKSVQICSETVQQGCCRWTQKASGQRKIIEKKKSQCRCQVPVSHWWQNVALDWTNEIE